MNTIYNFSMSSGLPAAAPPPPPPLFDDNGRSVHLAIFVEFRHIFQPSHHAANHSHFPPILGALIVPRHAFFAAPAAVLHRILSAIGVRVPPSALDAFAPRMLSFSWSLTAAPAASRPVLPLSVRIVAMTCPLTFRPRHHNVALCFPLTCYNPIGTATTVRNPAFGDEKVEVVEPNLRTSEFWERFVSSCFDSSSLPVDHDHDDYDDDNDDDEFVLGIAPATKSFIEALEEVTMSTTRSTKEDQYCAICMEDFSSPIESNGHDYREDEKNGHDDHHKAVVVGI